MNRPLAVIINSYNRVDLLKQALPSLLDSLAELPLGASITVFDAGSSDGSVEYVKRVSRQVNVPIHLVQPEAGEDGSFAAGVNAAVREAATKHPEIEWCFLYETDNYLKNAGALQKGIDLLQRREELAAVGFTVERHDGRKAGYGKKFPTVTSLVLGQQVTSRLNLLAPTPSWEQDDGHRFAYCDVVFTSPLLVEYSCWERIGGMDQEAFPFTDSDTDLCWRIWKSGRTCAVLDVNGVIHDNQEVQSEWSERRVRWLHESKLKVLKKHRNVETAMVKPGLVLRHVLEIIGLTVLFLFQKRPLESVTARFRLLASVLSEYRK
jgi:GT2 family glycosyltransferase